jgi:hypothetical protein
MRAEHPHEHERAPVQDDFERIGVGDLYEDCSYEPMLCVLSDYDADELVGVSLVNGRVGSCSPRYCGVRPLSLVEAVEIRATWPPGHLVEWARAEGVVLRLPQGEVRAEQVEPGQAGLPEPELRVMLDRLRGDSGASR